MLKSVHKQLFLNRFITYLFLFFFRSLLIFQTIIRRSRFYQSVMDTDHLKKNQSYRTLPETDILFICTFDPFGEGLPQYTFQNRCEEVPELTLQDHTVKYFINCTCQEEKYRRKCRHCIGT